VIGIGPPHDAGLVFGIAGNMGRHARGYAPTKPGRPKIYFNGHNSPVCPATVRQAYVASENNSAKSTKMDEYQR
jgi:hypothetical protein